MLSFEVYILMRDQEKVGESEQGKVREREEEKEWIEKEEKIKRKEKEKLDIWYTKLLDHQSNLLSLVHWVKGVLLLLL